MNKKTTTIFTTIICTFFAAVTLIYIFSLFTEYSKGKNSFNDNCQTIMQDVNHALQLNAPGSKEFKNSINALIVSKPEIVSLKMTYKGTEFYSYPENKTIQSKSMLIKPAGTTLNTPDGNLITLGLSLYLLSPASIYSKGKIAFILILAGTIAAIIYLIILSVSENKNKTSTSVYREEKTEPEPAYSSLAKDYEPQEVPFESSFTDSKDSNTEDVISFSDENITTEQNENTDNEPKYSFNPEPIIDSKQHTETQASFTENTEEVQENIEDKSQNFADVLFSKNKKDEQEPAPLTQDFLDSLEPVAQQSHYSSKSPFTLETELDERIAVELKKATENEEELCLFAIQIKDMDRGSLLADGMNNLILNTFKLKDYIFEYQEDGFIAMLQNVNSNESVELANKLYEELSEQIKRNGGTNKLGIGITTRCQRLVSPKRFIQEAKQALIYALESTDSPVVAFKVNPTKYRETLQKENA